VRRNNAPLGVQIITAFHSFEASADFAKSVERLLRSVPPKYLAGLHCVRLRDSAGLTSRERKRSGVDFGKSPRGVYYRASRTTSPQIHLFIDNMANWSKRTLRLPVMRDFIIAKTLFHELGHHIQDRIEPMHKSHEAAAEEWARKLTRTFLRKEYWYWAPVMRLILWISRILRRG
jgi:hypothetical protein